MADSSNDAPPKKKARADSESNMCDSTSGLSQQPTRAIHSSMASSGISSSQVSTSDQVPDSSNSRQRYNFTRMSSNSNGSHVSSSWNTQRPLWEHRHENVDGVQSSGDVAHNSSALRVSSLSKENGNVDSSLTADSSDCKSATPHVASSVSRSDTYGECSTSSAKVNSSNEKFKFEVNSDCHQVCESTAGPNTPKVDTSEYETVDVSQPGTSGILESKSNRHQVCQSTAGPVSPNVDTSESDIVDISQSATSGISKSSSSENTDIPCPGTDDPLNLSVTGTGDFACKEETAERKLDENCPNTCPLLKESDVGITEYISSHEGFNGVIKQRYSDFLVNEINLNGDLVQLTDLSVPPEETEVKNSPDDVLSEQWKTQLKELVETNDKNEHITFEVGENKEFRGKVHQAIREMFSGLESSTVKEEGKTCIKVVKSGQGGRSRTQAWPSGRGDYCRFVLYKENKDVTEALLIIAKYMRMKAGAFTFAGTKDRRARTCQDVTVYRVMAESLQKVNKSLRNIAMGNFRYCKNPLKLGDLKGNRFIVVLRNVTGKAEQIKKGVSSLQEVGFINYYGMQRFGTTSVATHHVGRALLKSLWKEAVELILKPRDGENDDVAQSRRIWWETRNAKEALKKIGRRQSIEKQLLMGLSKYDQKDYVSALNMIPRNSRLMYVHSYQSYVWNSLVSRRIQEFGLQPVIGDLVTRKKLNTVEEETDGSKNFLVPEVITEETLASWNVHNIVMPLPGWDMKYPENEVGQWYKEMLTKDGLDIDQMRHRVKDYSLAGAYRHIVVKPEDVTWELCTYDDVTVPLVQSDYDRLTGVPDPEHVADGKFNALKLELSLPSSVYATMAIREVLKSDTSAAHQMTLNVT